MNAVFLGINNEGSAGGYLSLALLMFLGILFSHIYRYIIVRFKWLLVKNIALIPRFLFSAILLGAITFSIGKIFNTFLNNESLTIHRSDIAGALNLSFIYLVWSLIYFLVNFIENYRKEEIKNLRWEASMNEIELNKLKSQLNPHFMFNAMNSIRALIDENPVKAKQALTQFSNVLRNALQMGKTKVVPFNDELQLVKDYLNVESIRYEERLKVNYIIDEASNEFQIPPMMLQTIVENAIKHGIAKYAKGGFISIKTKKENTNLRIEITNTGKLTKSENNESNGFGLSNTAQRLQLIYGDKAQFIIKQQSENIVECIVLIPLFDENKINS